MPDRDYITVSELNYYINRIFEAEELLHNVPVTGEVSGCSVIKGNCYFTLKDESSQIKIVYFNVGERFIPSNGEKVLVRGCVDYYQPSGQISLKAYEVKRFGVGMLYAKLQELKENLNKEGLFEESHKKPIPDFPANIGIITSVKGAALQDIFSTLGRYNSKQNISVIDVRVQGENCVKDVFEALINADHADFDVILLARGGGSFEDLYPFNNEKLVRTIYNMNTPVITAIGHETDYTLCDFVSDYRAITPTAAAEKIAFDISIERKKIFNILKKIKNSVNSIYSFEKERLISDMEDLSDEANYLLNEKYSVIRNLIDFAKIKIENSYKIKQEKLLNINKLLDSLSPTKLIEKGYFRIAHKNIIINNFSDVPIGSNIVIIGNNEKITAKITRKETI